MTDRRYPLHWPEGWARTPAHRRKRSKYKISEERAKQELLHSLRLLGARKFILSTNVRLRQDGLPLSNQRQPDDPGVAVYFERAGKDQVIACDCWDRLGDNYRGLGLAVEALRQLERCGASEILSRAFTGFAALPEQAGTVNWRIELGFHPSELVVTKEAINVNYRARAKEAAKSEETLRRLNEARHAALVEMGYLDDSHEARQKVLS